MLESGFYNMDIKNEQYVVYRHVSPSGKYYIGITKDYKTRTRDKHLSYKNCPVFFNAIIKYGWENIKHEIIDYCDSVEQAEERERYFISLYKTTEREFGYNICAGGDISKNDSIERRKKISETLKKNHAENPEFWKEVSRKASKTRTGVPLSKDHIQKLIKNHKGMTGHKQSDDFKRMMSERFTGIPTGLKNGAKAVNQYHLDGSFIKSFPSLREAGISIGWTSGTPIAHCCKGIRKTSGGYKWKFVE